MTDYGAIASVIGRFARREIDRDDAHNALVRLRYTDHTAAEILDDVETKLRSSTCANSPAQQS